MNLNKLALIGALTLTASAVFAEGQMPEPDNNGFFVAGSIGNALGTQVVTVSPSAFGSTAANMPNSSQPDFPVQTMGYFGALGELGYNFLDYLGVEIYGAYLGNQKSLNDGLAGGSVYSWAFGGNLLGYIPFDDNKFDLFAKLGMGGMYSKFTANAANFTRLTGVNTAVSTTQGIYDFGAGGQYYYSDNVTFRASWDQFSRWNNKVIGNLRYNLWTLGLDYHFTV